MANLLPNAPSMRIHLYKTILSKDKWKFKAQRNSKPTTLLTISECSWATNYPDLQKACFLARVCLTRPPRQYQFYNIASILQEGPTCGLTALSMLLGGIPTTKELLHIARRKQFTNNGEMFSAQNLFQLICDNTSTIHERTLNSSDKNIDGNIDVSQQIQCQMHCGPLQCEEIKQSLIQGACLFVPYPFHKPNRFQNIII